MDEFGKLKGVTNRPGRKAKSPNFTDVPDVARDPHKKKLFKDYASVIFGTGTARALSFLTCLILARKLGKEGFGVFSLFFTIMMLVWQLPGVIDSAYVRFARAGNTKRRADYLKVSIWAKGVFATFLFLCSYPVGKATACYIFEKPDSGIFVVLGIVGGAFGSLLGTVAGTYHAEERFGFFSIVNGFFYLAVLFAVGIIIVSPFRLGPLSGSLAYVGTAMIIGIVGFGYVCWKAKPIYPVRISFFGEVLRFAKWLLAANMAYILFHRLDVMVLARYVSFEQLGIYGAAIRIVTIAGLFTGGINAVFMPRGTNALRSKETLKIYLKESVITSTLLGVFVIGIIICSPKLIEILFGSQFGGAGTIARILLVGAIFVVFQTPFLYLFYAANDSRPVFCMAAIRLVAMVIGLTVLVPKWGLLGAAIASSGASMIGMGYTVFKSVGVVRSGLDGFLNPK